MRVEFTVNDSPVTVGVDPMRRLLDVLREDLGLTGTKEGCGEGECGACSVLFDGDLVNSCLVPVAQVAGAEVTTIEGVRESALGETVTASFAETHAVQCGFCTPGMAMATVALLRQNGSPSEDDARRAISGNICRCTGYDMIVDGILEAARRVAGDGRGEEA